LITAGDSYLQILEAKKGQTLIFEYFANRNFEIIVEDGKEILTINSSLQR